MCEGGSGGPGAEPPGENIFLEHFYAFLGPRDCVFELLVARSFIGPGFGSFGHDFRRIGRWGVCGSVFLESRKWVLTPPLRDPLELHAGGYT